MRYNSAVNNKRLAAYVRGFGKGLLFVLADFLILFCYSLLLLQFKKFSANQIQQVIDIKLQIMNWMLGLAIVFYVVSKYKLMKSWLVLALIFNVLVVPFMLGDLELKKSSKKIARSV